jgi:hypothetical protein
VGVHRERQGQLILLLGVVAADIHCTTVAGHMGIAVEVGSWIYEVVEKSAAVVRSVCSAAAAAVSEASSVDRIVSMEVVPRRCQSLRLHPDRTGGLAGVDDFPLYLGVLLEQDSPRKKLL